MGTNLGNIGETNVNFVQNEAETDATVQETKPEDYLSTEELIPTSPEATAGNNDLSIDENDILDLA